MINFDRPKILYDQKIFQNTEIACKQLGYYRIPNIPKVLWFGMKGTSGDFHEVLVDTAGIANQIA